MTALFEFLPDDSGRFSGCSACRATGSGRDDRLRRAAWRRKAVPQGKRRQLSRGLPPSGRLGRSWCRRRGRWRAQRGDEAQNITEQVPRDGNLGHLKGDIPAVADNLRADLYQLFS